MPPVPLTVRSFNLWKRLVYWKRTRRGKKDDEIDSVLTLLNSGRKITQDGQRDLDRIAMTLAEESDEE